jgi:superkiller protein 3
MSEIPTGDWSWVNKAAERFERAWKKGPRPRIEDYLMEVPESQWPPLLQELMRVEGELRAQAGEEPNAEEYRRRFPEYDDVIASVFASALARSVRNTLPSTEGAATIAARDQSGKLPPELANHPDYEIIRELGHGGMGVVFLAHNRITGLDVVLKVIGVDIIKSRGVRDRFQREIRAVVRLHHPNIVTAHTAFHCGESLVFAMEYVDGLDLARLVKAKGPMPVKHASYFVHQAALGLQHAHEAGMVHRDIKPGNLMLTHKRGKAVIKILDFGLAKAEREEKVLDPVAAGPSREPGEAGGLTLPGEMLGTPDFIAPEQIADSQKADIRADIYSLGCTLYYLLSGRAPFPSKSTRDTLRAHGVMEALLLNLVRPEVPAELAALVAKMMAKEPDRRFQTPNEVAGALAPCFKKQAAPDASPSLGVDGDLAPDVAGDAGDRAAGTGHGMWSSLIDFTETVDDPDTAANEAKSARYQPRWLWPSVAAGVLVVGLIAAWAVGVFTMKSTNAWLIFEDLPELADVLVDGEDVTVMVRRGKSPFEFSVTAGKHRVLVEKDGVELAGEEVSIGSGERKPIRVRLEPFVASEPRKISAPAAAAPPARDVPKPMLDNQTLSQQLLDIASFRTSDRVFQARLLPDDRHVLYETSGKKRALWSGDLTDSTNPRELQANAPGWVRLAISSDGRFAVLAGEDETLWRWDLQTGQTHRLRTGAYNITAIALSPDDHLVAFVRRGAIQLCDAVTGGRGENQEFEGQFGTRTDLLAFCPDGRRIISTHADHAIRVWDVKTGRESGHTATDRPVTGLALFPPDGHRVLISTPSPGPAVGIWNLQTGMQLRQYPRFGTSIALSSDGLRALIGGGNFMQLWDLETGEELVRKDLHRAVLHVAFSPDQRLAVASTDESVRVWALPPHRSPGEQPPVVEVAEFPKSGGIHGSVVVSPDGRWLLTGDWPNSVRLWDRETQRLIRPLDENGKEIRSVAFSPDGRLALSGGDDGVVRLWDVASRGHREFRGHADNVTSVAFSRDGSRAYSAGGGLLSDVFKDGTDFAVRVWDVKTGQQLHPFEGHKGIVWSVAVSTDGRHVLSGGNDAVPILWDARTGREIRKFFGHTDVVMCVAFLPDGRRAVSSGNDGTIRLWNVGSGREVPLHFREPTGQNRRLAVSPDGRRLFSASGNELRYWNLDTGKLIQLLQWQEGPCGGCFTADGRHVIWGGWDGALRMYKLTELGPANRSAAAIAAYKEAIRLEPHDALAHDNLGKALQDHGELAEAITEYKKAIELTADDDVAHSNLGKALQDQGKLAEAIIEYKKAIQLNADDAHAHNNLGKALHHEGKLPEAITEYKNAIQLKPDDALAHHNLGKALQDQGLIAEAIIEYKKAIQLKPDDALAHIRLGYALQGQGVLAEAIAEYRKASDINPDDAAAHTSLANALSDQGKLEEAIAEYETAIRIEPDDPDLHNGLGNALSDQGKLEGAIAKYREAIRIKPDYSLPHNSLGNALSDQGKLEESIAEYKTAIRIKPKYADPHNGLGNALYKQGLLAEAIAEYREAIRIKPDYALPHSNLGDALSDQGNLDEAIAEYETAIRIKPDYALPHNNLGNALYKRGKPAEAIAEYRDAIRINGGDASPHSNLGIALRAQGKQQEAIAEYREAIRIKPDFALAHNNLAWALVLSPKRPRRVYDEGLLHARKAVELAQKGENHFGTLALAEYRSGHWPESLAASERSMKLRTGMYAYDWFLLAMARAQKGDKAEARKWFDKAVAADPKTNNAELRQFWSEAAELLGLPGPDAAGPGSPAVKPAEKPR